MKGITYIFVISFLGIACGAIEDANEDSLNTRDGYENTSDLKVETPPSHETNSLDKLPTTLETKPSQEGDDSSLEELNGKNDDLVIEEDDVGMNGEDQDPQTPDENITLVRRVKLYVAVGTRGARSYSTDGLNWTMPNGFGQETSGDNNFNFRGVCTHKDRAYAVGGGANNLTGSPWYARVSSTSDGINWDTQVFTRNQGFSWIAGCSSGNGILVLAGGLGRSYVLDESNTFVRSATNIGGSFRAIGYGAGRFVAIGDQYSVYVSKNGQDWFGQRLSQNARHRFNSIAYGNGRFVVTSSVVAAGPAQVLVSNDLSGDDHLTSSETIPESFDISPQNTTFQSVMSLNSGGRVYFHDGMFYLFDQSQKIHVSTDGTQWTAINKNFPSSILTQNEEQFIGYKNRINDSLETEWERGLGPDFAVRQITTLWEDVPISD